MVQTACTVTTDTAAPMQQQQAHLVNACGQALGCGVPHHSIGVLVVVKQLQGTSRIKGQEGDALHLQARAGTSAPFIWHLSFCRARELSPPPPPPPQETDQLVSCTSIKRADAAKAKTSYSAACSCCMCMNGCRQAALTEKQSCITAYSRHAPQPQRPRRACCRPWSTAPAACPRLR